MAKGQTISGDFIISMAVFLAILAILLPLFTQLSEDRSNRLLSEDLSTRALFATDLALKTPGIPEDWNGTNAMRTGFANVDGRINRTKIARFAGLAPGSAKILAGLEGLEFNLSFYRGRYFLMTGVAASPAAYFFVNESSMFDAVNGSGLVWDLYYGGNGSVDRGDSINFYTGPKAAVFDQVIANASYRTVLVESPQLSQQDIDIDALKDFVAGGGILIYVGDATLISSGFSMSSATDPGGNGIVKRRVLIDAPENSTVAFGASNWYFYRNQGDSELAIEAENAAIQGAAFIGSWNHGIGKIYYATTMNGSVDGKNLTDAVMLVGRKAEFVTDSLQNSIANSRPVVFDDELNSIGRVVMVVGR